MAINAVENAVTTKDLKKAVEAFKSLLETLAKIKAEKGKQKSIEATNEKLLADWDYITDGGTRTPCVIMSSAQSENVWNEVMARVNEYNDNAKADFIHVIRMGGYFLTDEASREKIRDIVSDILVQKGKQNSERPIEQFNKINEDKKVITITGVDKSVLNYMREDGSFGKDIAYAAVKGEDGKINAVTRAENFMHSRNDGDDLFSAMVKAKAVTNSVKGVTEGTEYRAQLLKDVLTYNQIEPMIVASAKGNKEFIAVSEAGFKTYALVPTENQPKVQCTGEFLKDDYATKGAYENALIKNVSTIWNPIVVTDEVAKNMARGKEIENFKDKVAAVKTYLAGNPTKSVMKMLPAKVNYKYKAYVSKVAEVFSNKVEDRLYLLDAELNASQYLKALNLNSEFRQLSDEHKEKVKNQMIFEFKAQNSIFIANDEREKEIFDAAAIKAAQEAAGLDDGWASTGKLKKAFEQVEIVDTLNDHAAIDRAIEDVKKAFERANTEPGHDEDIDSLVAQYGTSGDDELIKQLSDITEGLLDENIQVLINEKDNPALTGENRLPEDAFEREDEKLIDDIELDL